MCGFPDYLPPDSDYWEFEKELEEQDKEEPNPN
jgi:hypothetical protein